MQKEPVGLAPFCFWNFQSRGASCPKYFVRRVTAPPSCVSYCTRSTPAKTPGATWLPEACFAKPAIVSSPKAGADFPRDERATSMRSGNRASVTSMQARESSSRSNDSRQTLTTEACKDAVASGSSPAASAKKRAAAPAAAASRASASIKRRRVLSSVATAGKGHFAGFPAIRAIVEAVHAEAHVLLAFTDGAIFFAGAAFFRQITLRAKRGTFHERLVKNNTRKTVPEREQPRQDEAGRHSSSRVPVLDSGLDCRSRRFAVVRYHLEDYAFSSTFVQLNGLPAGFVGLQEFGLADIPLQLIEGKHHVFAGI